MSPRRSVAVVLLVALATVPLAGCLQSPTGGEQDGADVPQMPPGGDLGSGTARPPDGGGVDDAAAEHPPDANATMAWSPHGPVNVINWRGDIQRSGYVPDATVPDAVQLAWRTGGMNVGEHTAAKGSAVYVNGTLLVGTDSGTLYAFDDNGTQLWAAETEPSQNGIHGTPSVANGTAYVGAYDGAMYAFDLETGERLWRTRIGDSIGSSPLHYRGLIFVSVETREPSGIMAILDAATGEELWRDERITDHPHSSVAIDEEAGVFVVGANDGVLYAWDLSSWEFLWGFETDDAIKGPIMVHNASAYLGSWDDHVYRVDLSTGQAVWRAETGSYVMSGAAYDPVNDLVLIGSHDRYVYAFDADTGERAWRHDLGGRVTSSPTVANGTVLVGSYDERLYALDAATGEELWTFETEGQVTSSALVFGDRIAILDRADEADGSLWVLEPAA